MRSLPSWRRDSQTTKFAGGQGSQGDDPDWRRRGIPGDAVPGEIFTDTCDQLGIRWSLSNWRNVSISHWDSVAFLDTFVGPKS